MLKKIGTVVSLTKAKWAPLSILAVLSLLTVLCPPAVMAIDEECDPASTIYNSPADNLCVPAIATTQNYTIDAHDNDWVTGNYYDPNPSDWQAGMTQSARLRISRKATGIGKSDLYLFLEAHGDNLTTLNDEIRIGLNPGTDPANNTLIKIHPFTGAALTTLTRDVYNYNPGTTTWSQISNAWLPIPADIVARNDAPTASWYVEIKIPLDQIPNHPITSTDFRLYVQITADDNVNAITYQWPEEYEAPSNNNICVNPQRWHPMSFGGGCAPDLNIANGVYSCSAIYVLRNGAKSSEIGIHEVNEFHADVTNPDTTKDAPNAQVYLTLLQLGISTGPLAMNYDNTDPIITNWFKEKYGTWMLAIDRLDHGTPKPPTPYTAVHNSTNTAARFNWKPADETRFGLINNFVGDHKCTAAFVNFKDDPNFDNNFSYCNTSVVKCPTGEICPLSFHLGSFFAHGHPAGAFQERVIVSALNEPYPGWLSQGTIAVDGRGIKRIGNNTFEIEVPEQGEIPLQFSFTPPGGQPRKPGIVARSLAVGDGATIHERDDYLKTTYGNMPLVFIEGFAAYAYETGANGEPLQLYRPTSYVAFAVDTGTKGPPPPPPGSKRYELVLPFVGGSFFHGGVGLDPGVVAGARFGYFVKPKVVLAAEHGVTFTDSGQVHQFLGNVRYDFKPLQVHQWTPFVTAGAGLVRFQGFGVNGNVFAFHGGAGVTYQFKNSFGVRFDERIFRLNSFMGLGTTANFQTTGGLVFWF